MKISPARISAFDVLLKIETEKAFSSILLPQYESGLSDLDRTLCHELTLGVLRRQIYLDRLIEKFAGTKKLDEAVRVALRLGLYQLLFLDRVPAYSAINESVELVGRARKASARGFVNAILRKVSRGAVKLNFSDEIDRISVETSHPSWLIERWVDEFGQSDAFSIAEANNRPATLAFRLTAKGISAGLQSKEDWTASRLVSGCFIASRATSELVAFADSGTVYFQDEASQLVASTIQLSDDERFLDVCAAPGSKSTAVVAQMAAGSATVAAGDLHWSRVRQLRENARRQGVDWINIVQYDAQKCLPFAEETFDCVLVDAPCSGTGTIRHNPELRYFLGPSDFVEFKSKQLAILKSASKMVKPGGQLIYSTCSLEREENEAVCNSFGYGVEGFEKVTPKIPDRFLTLDGFARTLPHRDGMDGFFIAQFTRKSAHS